MKMVYYFLVLILSLVTLIGCKSNKEIENLENSKITITEDSKEDPVQLDSKNKTMEGGDYIKLIASGKSSENFELKIYRNSFSKLKGFSNTSHMGEHSGKTSSELSSDIFKLVDNINLDELKTDMSGGMGSAIYKLEFNIGEENKKVTYKQAANLGLQSLQSQIIKAKNSISWKK